MFYYWCLLVAFPLFFLNDQVDNNLFNHKRDNTNSKSNCIFSSLFSDGYNTVVGLFFTFLVLNKSSDVVERVALNQSERPCQLILVIQVCRRYSPWGSRETFLDVFIIL